MILSLIAIKCTKPGCAAAVRVGDVSMHTFLLKVQSPCAHDCQAYITLHVHAPHSVATQAAACKCMHMLLSSLRLPLTLSLLLLPLQLVCRLVSQAVVINNKLWLIGGWDSSISGPDAFLGDVWTLDLETWAWQPQHLAGNGVLQGISRHQAAAVGQHIYIHTHRTTDHILRLDTSASPPVLEQLPVTGSAPSSRGLHSMVHVNGQLYVLFGAPQKGPMLDDVYRLDLATLTWEDLTGQLSGPKPHPRCSAGVAAVADKVLVVGGAFYGASGGLEMLQDAYVLDTSSSSWLVPEVAAEQGSSSGGGVASGGMPSARNAAVMVPMRAGAAGGQPQLLLAGGWRAFVETYNDTYLVTLS